MKSFRGSMQVIKHCFAIIAMAIFLIPIFVFSQTNPLKQIQFLSRSQSPKSILTIDRSLMSIISRHGFVTMVSFTATIQHKMQDLSGPKGAVSMRYSQQGFGLVRGIKIPIRQKVYAWQQSDILVLNIVPV